MFGNVFLYGLPVKSYVPSTPRSHSVFVIVPSESVETELNVTWTPFTAAVGASIAASGRTLGRGCTTNCLLAMTVWLSSSVTLRRTVRVEAVV